MKARKLRICVGALGLAALAVLALGAKTPPKAAIKMADYPTSEYTIRQIEGWKIYVHKDLLTGKKELGDKALNLLRVKLYDVNRVVPPKALADLHKIPIWISVKDRLGRHPCAAYHPSSGWLKSNGYNPDKARSVDIMNAGTFVRWTQGQPAMVLHELAHGYHHHFLPGGYGNKELAAAFKKMVAGKKYESVLYFTGGKKRAYAMNNPQEYFAELSEAYFGTNDFYPFVRAQVATHDGDMYKLLKKLWEGQPSSKATTYTPTSSYTIRQIEGWKNIYVHNDLLTTHKEVGREVLKVLQAKLYDVSRAVPPPALAELRKVPIWMEYKNPKGGSGCYHPSRQWLVGHARNPDKAQSIEFGDARAFLRYTRIQPAVVLHELAHGYQDRVLPSGYGNMELKAAHKRAVAGKTYDSVSHISGRKKRAYAMGNPMEYFAELSEAFYGTNDFYPFVRAEVMKHDPQMYKMLKKLWYSPPAKSGDPKGKGKQD